MVSGEERGVFFGFQAHSAPPDMTRKVRVLRRTVSCVLPPLSEALAVFTGLSARGLFKLDTLDDELDNAPVDVSIYSESEAYLTLAELNSAPAALSNVSQAHPSPAGHAHDVAIVSSAGPNLDSDSPRLSIATSAPLQRKQAGRQLVLHEVGFRATKKPRTTSLPKY